MNKEPRLLIWNFTLEEKARLDTLLIEIGAPSAATIDSTRGHLSLREIIHTEASGENRLESEEKVILFYNIPPKGVFFLIDTFKKAGFPQTIYAVVTEHSIEWSFSKLLEHLISERDSAQQRTAEGEKK